MYNLKDTSAMMLSGDPNKELMAEYIQTYIRYNKLKEQDINQFDDEEIKSIIIQKIDMYKYLNLLKIRLKERDIIVRDEDIEL